MKTKIYLTVAFGILIQVLAYAQVNKVIQTETQTPFDFSFWNSYCQQLHLTPKEQKEFISSQQVCYLQHQHLKNNNNQKQVLPNSNSTFAGSCINIDFENGNFNGWNPSCGFHPLFNPLGCCPNAGGQQTIMTGTGIDPVGGFPVVAPGGNFSLRLGNNQTGGEADRIEQTFLVSAANANFTYKYAVVFQDPGHTANQQPAFTVEMVDTNGVQIPCTFYNVAAGGGIPGFITAGGSLIYKPWTSVVVDLTNYIGQNITIRFTTYDCALGGHYGYAYIDGICASFVSGTNDTICAGATKNYCGPTGFGSYTWNGPGVINNTNQCITATAPGVYTCQTTLVTGCTGPVFTYTLNNFPNPVVSFNSLSGGACAQQYTFANTSSIAGGAIVNYNWNFGTSTSTLSNPIINFPGAGSYIVTLSAASNNGCTNSISQSIVIYPNPNVNFTAPNNCQNASTNFSNGSNIASGSISFNWNFGNGSSSSQTNPTITFTNAGTYSVTLTAISNQGCVSATINTITVFPLPSAGFTYTTANVCAQQFTFTNTSSISSGVLNYNWNFGVSTSTLANPTNNFTSYGNYTVNLTATSNNGCSSSITQSIVIYPNPVANFSAANACQFTTVNFVNNSNIAAGTISSNWNFGSGNSSNQVNPFLTYMNAGNYVVSLSVTSNQGCVATASNVVTIYPVPQLNFSPNSVCLGNATSLNNFSSILSGTISNWIWDFDSNGIPNSNLQNPSFVYPNYGTYTVSLQAVSNNNCVSTITKTVEVYPNPTASFVSYNVCFGAASNFTNISSMVSGNTISGYNWNFGNNNQSPIANPQISYTAPGTYTVQLTAYSNHNCSNTFSSTVTIHHLPNVNFSSNIACKNQSTSFNNSTIIGTGTISKWRWDFENDGVWDDTLTVNPSLIYPTSGNFNCKLQAVSNFQCASQKVNNVIVHANPVAGFATKSTCLTDVTTFTNLSSSADGAISSNQWDFNGDGVVDNVFASPSTTYTSNGVYMVRLEVQTEFGCSNVVTKSVYVNPKPQPAFSGQNKIGCPSLCVNFTNSSTIATGSITTSQWQFGDGSLPDYSKNPTHCYNSGNYEVTLRLVSDSGCFAKLSQPNYVIVHPTPIAGFDVNPNEVDENEPKISVTSNATGATLTNYFLNDGSSFSTQSFEHLLTNVPGAAPIIFQVVKNEFGCGDTLSKIIEVKPTYVIYIPNTFTPNGDGINDGFFAKGVGINKFAIQIYDRWGHLLFETNDINNAWDGNSKGSSAPIKQDVYVWKAQVVDVFNKNHDLTGHVSLLK